MKKTTIKSIYILLTLLTIVLYSCNKGINDSSKRNENWVWFVDKPTGQGIWIPLGGKAILENGLPNMEQEGSSEKL